MAETVEPIVYLAAEVLCKAITKKAMLLSNNGHQVWVPRSVIEDEGGITQKKTRGNVLIEEWFADKENLWDEWVAERIES